MKKPTKLLTNEHLLENQENNFSLAEAAIEKARKDIEQGREFSLQGVLDDVLKAQKPEEILESIVEIEEKNKDI